MWEYIVGPYAFLKAYQELRIFMFKRRSKGPVKIMKGAEPFFLRSKNKKKVALMLHGFTASPSEFRKMSKLFIKNGISCYAPLLPGHGTTPERLSLIKYEQWIEEVESAINMLAEEYEEIHIIGNSGGGNLAFITANYSQKIKSLTTLGTPVIISNEKLKRYLIFPIIRRLKLFQKKSYHGTPNMDKINKHRVAYESIPLSSVKQGLKIFELSKSAIPKIKTPILVMQTEDDRVADNRSGDYIIEKIKSKVKGIVTIPKSYHVFMLDKYADKVNEIVLEFVKKRRIKSVKKF